MPWVSPKDMKRSRIGDAEDHVSESAVGNGTRLVPEDTLLMVVRGMILAHTFPVAITTAPVTFNQDVKALRPSPSFEPDFMLHWLQAAQGEVLRLVDVANHGTKRLPTERLHAMSVPRPPLPEQRKIAAILSSVDETIEKSEAVIDQLQVVKKAMMEELLTRGMPGRHTRFKQTEIGEIPEGWEVVELGDVLDGIDAGWSPQCEAGSAGPDEWGVLKVSAVSWGEFRPWENKRLPADLMPRPHLEVRDGDVILSRANTPDLVGRSVLASNPRPKLMLSDKLLRLRPSSRTIPPYVNLVLGLPRARAYISEASTGTSLSMKNISQDKIRQLPVALAPIEEQRAICDAIAAAGECVRAADRELGSLRLVKSSLSAALLSGDLRVPLDEAPA
ncbi:MAG: restriction endonuclease subunit S [Polyangiales bacterium]